MRSDMVKRMRDNKDDKGKLKDIADNVKEWKKLYSSFGGLTPILRKLENAKTEAEQSEYCKAGVKIIDRFQRVLATFNNGNLRKTKKVMDLKNTTIILRGILHRTKADLNKGIHT